MIYSKEAQKYPKIHHHNYQFHPDYNQIDEALNEIKTYALARTFSLEAPNEYNISHGSDTDWMNSRG
jgi:hypothetical protein